MTGRSHRPGRSRPRSPSPLSDFVTPFRERHERSRALDLQAQVEECADYLQHPDVLVAEFLESYYLVERKLDPELHDERLAATQAEVVLEPFFDSLELRVRAGSRTETILCVGGAFDPLPGFQHPALERRGVDYVGVRDGSRRVVLGVTDAHRETTVYGLLLRGLNCLAELAPPFQVARLRRHVLRERVDPEPVFDLQLGIAPGARPELETSLLVLTRDLAEVFKRHVEDEKQFEGAIGRIECVELGAADGALRVRWRT